MSVLSRLFACMTTLPFDVKVCLQVTCGREGDHTRTLMLTASFQPTIASYTWNTLEHCSCPDHERTFSAFLVGVHSQLPNLRHALSQGRSASDAFQATGSCTLQCWSPLQSFQSLFSQMMPMQAFQKHQICILDQVLNTAINILRLC